MSASLRSVDVRPAWRGAGFVVVATRAGLVMLAGVLWLIGDSKPSAFAIVLLAGIAAAASTPTPDTGVRRMVPVVEAVAVTVVIISTDPMQQELLVYLVAPALAAGLQSGVSIAVTASGLPTLVLLLARATGQQGGDVVEYTSAVATWTLIALGVGLLAAWVRRIQATPTPSPNESYASAYRLLSQLRIVSRQLSGGLDPVGLAQALLQNLRAGIAFDRGALFTRSQGGVLVPLAVEGTERVDWDASTDDDSPFAEAWTSEEPVLRNRLLDGSSPGQSAVLPLRIGLRTFGLVALESDAGGITADRLRAASPIAEESALRLETALLFSDIRSIATAEERRRLAREIHDGIAQELASLGYVIDDLAAGAQGDESMEQALRGLRSELTRIITELRLSIFDLRSEVGAQVGLGSALSDYVRTVGTGSNLTVHLILAEAPTRLPIEAEAELLRIAQEAITNARKHANAQNLWVTCTVEPPIALLRVEDDGEGLGSGRKDSFGIEIMRERAARLGARLTVSGRDTSGTRVEVTIGDHHNARQDESRGGSPRVHDGAVG